MESLASVCTALKLNADLPLWLVIMIGSPFIFTEVKSARSGYTRSILLGNCMVGYVGTNK